MTELKLLAAAAILAALAATPGPAQARITATVPISWPSLRRQLSTTITDQVSLPGTFAYYDGPSTNAC